jgi:hypothetical protein
MRLAAVLLPLALLASSAALAREITPAEEREVPFDNRFPLCHDPLVIEKIGTQFAEKESRFWNSALTIVDVEKIRPLAWKPWGLDYIPRRFCTATAILSDGRRHRMDYSVREDLDLTVFGQVRTWGVEFCVTGLDRNWAYQPNCKMARP